MKSTKYIIWMCCLPVMMVLLQCTYWLFDLIHVDLVYLNVVWVIFVVYVSCCDLKFILHHCCCRPIAVCALGHRQSLQRPSPYDVLPLGCQRNRVPSQNQRFALNFQCHSLIATLFDQIVQSIPLKGRQVFRPFAHCSMRCCY